jgi:hypothetical protein
MAKKFVPLQKHPSEMTGEELSLALDGLADAEVMRSLLMAEVQAVRDGVDRETRTMRNLWYSLVKPALSRAGILNKKTKKGNPVPWAGKLSSYLAELVRMGATSYEELSIVDGSRQRQPAVVITQPVADVRLVGAHFPWLILVTEKDTIWGEVEALASLYGVSAISSSGQPSFACTENMVRAITQSDAYTEDHPIVVLSLTDYDPAGYTIAKAQFVQVQETAGCEVYHERLGLLPSQLTPEERLKNAYEPKDKGLAEWYTETGGVDGEPLGLELDALPLSRLRRMFAESIEGHVDLDERRADLRGAYLDLLACELLRPDFDDKRRALQEAVKAGSLWDIITTKAIPDALFRQAAEKGMSSLNPLSDLQSGDLFGCADDVRGAMRSVLAELGGNGTGT